MFENFPIEKYKKVPYNKNMSYQEAEINYLKSLPKDINWAVKGDDIPNYFIDFLRSKNVEVTPILSKKIKQYLKSTRKPIITLKDYYKRIRPYELAEQLNIDFNYIPFSSAKTPAYPSGHSTQAVFLSKLLSLYYPELENELKYVANDICFSRLIARVHFPSDDMFGRSLGLALFEHIKNKI